MKTASFFLYVFCCILLAASCGQESPKTEAAAAEAVVAEKPNYGGWESQEKWGEHLVTIAGCHDCHSPKKFTEHGMVFDSSRLLSGHPAEDQKLEVDLKEVNKKGLIITNDLTQWVGPWGTSYTANLTSDPTGTGNWSEEQFIYAIRNGKMKGLKDSRPILPPMPWEVYKSMTDDELKAIFAYLKTTKPIKNLVPQPLPPAPRS